VEQQSYGCEQASPSVRQDAPVPPLGTAVQLPEEVALQVPVPEQHSDSLEQALPICLHASLRHTPPTQFSEQQSAAALHASPAGVQNSLVPHTAWPPPAGGAQVGEQHSAAELHAVPSALQVVEPWVQVPPSQKPVQQGFPASQLPPSGAQSVAWMQVALPVAPKQVSPVQQSAWVVQAPFCGVQAGGGGSIGPEDPPPPPLEHAASRASREAVSASRRRAGRLGIGRLAPRVPDERDSEQLPQNALRLPGVCCARRCAVCVPAYRPAGGAHP
jgi:hypothetical protein